MTYAIDPNPLWKPDPVTLGETRMAHFMQSTDHARYTDLWRWSLDRPEAFWSQIWDFCGVVGEKGQRILLDGDKMPGARWFPEAR